MDLSSDAFYRAQEARCRRLAGASPNLAVAKELLRTAETYHRLAGAEAEGPKG